MRNNAIDRAQQALDRGLTQEQAAAEAGTSLRTLSRWVKIGLVRSPIRRRHTSTSAEGAPGADYREIWSLADLEEFFDRARVAPLQLVLETEAQRGNWRVHEWIGRMREVRHVPAGWREAIGFLPILSRDVDAPALAALADLMSETQPWENAELKGLYRRKAIPVMNQALIEIGKWSAGVGLVPFYQQRDEGGPPDFMGIADTTEGPYGRDQKSLEKKFGGTLFGVLIELVGRLPDIDRPRGRRLVQTRRSILSPFGRKRASMAMLAISWCMTVDDQWVESARNAYTSLWPEEYEGEEE